MVIISRNSKRQTVDSPEACWVFRAGGAFSPGRISTPTTIFKIMSRYVKLQIMDSLSIYIYSHNIGKMRQSPFDDWSSWELPGSKSSNFVTIVVDATIGRYVSTRIIRVEQSNVHQLYFQTNRLVRVNPRVFLAVFYVLHPLSELEYGGYPI